MKRAIHMRCTQQFLYFESYKIIKTAAHYCLFQCTLSVPHLQYQHILLTRVLGRNFKKRTISSTCTNNGSKIKLSTHRGRITFAWRLTGITFARRKSITIARKMYLRLFAFARIICYLEYI